jgi:hypothetical protein
LERLFFVLTWCVAFSLAARLSYEFIYEQLPASQHLIVLGLILAVGILISSLSMGMVYTLRAFSGTPPHPAYISDARKPWSLETPYSLVNPYEEAAELGAIMMAFPGPIRRKMVHNEALAGKIQLLRGAFLGKDSLVQLFPWEPSVSSEQRMMPGLGTTLRIIYWALLTSLAIGIPAMAWWVVFQELAMPTGRWLSPLAFSMVLMAYFGPLISLRIHLAPLTRKLPERLRVVLRFMTASVASIFYEIQRLAIVAMLALIWTFMTHPAHLRQALQLRPVPWREMATNTLTASKEGLTELWKSLPSMPAVSNAIPPAPRLKKSDDGYQGLANRTIFKDSEPAQPFFTRIHFRQLIEEMVKKAKLVIANPPETKKVETIETSNPPQHYPVAGTSQATSQAGKTGRAASSGLERTASNFP